MENVRDIQQSHVVSAVTKSPSKLLLEAAKTLRNRKRTLRRKRSRLNYIKKLKRFRRDRSTNELVQCLDETFVSFNSICGTSKNMAVPQYEVGISEVSEWQHQHQVAYWKARAISLEYENRMLHQHIKNMYAQQTRDYEQQTYEPIQISKNKQESSNIHSKQTKKSKHVKNLEKANDVDMVEEETKPLLKQDEFERRQREAKELYGDDSAKIMGMETAMEVNFDFIKQMQKSVYWPNIPIKFDQ